MNERIRELAKELTQNGKFGSGHRENIFSGHIDLGKFAELIVRECCQMMMDLEVKYPANLTVREIKEHFGVEE